MKQVGNAENSKLNGEWAKHVRRSGKKHTSGKRRMNDKKIIKCALTSQTESETGRRIM